MLRLFLVVSCCLSLVLAAGRPAAAQCLSLDELLALAPESSALATAPAGDGLPPNLQRMLPKLTWAYQGQIAGTHDYFWTSPAFGGPLDQPTTSWLCVRPGQATRDVVLKTTRAACVRQLRQELEKKLRPEPVTCVECEGVRYQSEAYSVTIYSHKKGQYPFVVVVRQPLATAPGGARTEPATARRP